MLSRSEAWAALAHDPVGREDRVVTVKVGPTTGNLGLFSHFAYLDLTTSAEADAERLILERARKAVELDYRAKPSTRPGFPGGAKRKVPEKPSFPGVIHNLPHFNPDFVGREQVLAELHRRLTSGRGPAVLIPAITGLDEPRRARQDADRADLCLPPRPGGDPRRARRGNGQDSCRGSGAAGERGAARPVE